MKINNLIDRVKVLIKDGWNDLKQVFREHYKIYVTFIIATSTFCIVLAQVSKDNNFRGWYYNLINKDVISKAIENEEALNHENYGSFITYYRFNAFGATNPEQMDANAPMVALTFDDGPNPDNTRRILKVLEENYSRATFFVVGTNAEKYPEVLQEIASSGSEIGNHTYSHANLTNIDSADVEEEIDKVNRAVKKATGEIATVIRPPYGAYNEEILNQLQQPVILWGVDTEDWESRNAQIVADGILENIEDGDIILMHDIYDSTAEAVEILVPRLKEMGYQVVTVSEMARLKGKELELHKAHGAIKKTEE